MLDDNDGVDAMPCEEIPLEVDPPMHQEIPLKVTSARVTTPDLFTQGRVSTSGY